MSEYELVLSDEEGDAIVKVGDRYEIRSDGWLYATEEDRCPPEERFRYTFCFASFDTVREAGAWLDGYHQGARENM